MSNSDESIARGQAATAKPKQQIFRFNPGKQEKIFPPKHPYYKTAEKYIEIESTLLKNKNIESGVYDIVSKINKDTVDFIKPTLLDKKSSDESDIIKRISGGDKTQGYCSSIALAYAGNKAGLNVHDFRGSDSCKFFSLSGNITEIVNHFGGTSIREYNDFVAAKSLLGKCEKGKEYFFSCGKHVSIIRKTVKGFEYLEMQSKDDSGWHSLTSKKLKDRFGCQKSHTIHGLKLQPWSNIIDISNLSGDDFSELLGYLNTNLEKQKKGKGGKPK